MRVTILGANSFIARNIIHEWKKRRNHGLEAELFLYDYQEKQIDGEINYKQINILNRDSVCDIQMDVDILYVFIGKTGTLQGLEEYDTFIDINEKALLNILSVHVEKKSQAKVIFPSTRLVYRGKKGFLKESNEKEFKTVYAMNKFACEQYLRMFHDMYQIPYAIFRICVPYGTMIPNASSYGTAEFMLGKAQSGDSITLYGDGSVRRTLTHMQDLCTILIDGGMSSNCMNDIFNIGGENYSLAEMAEKISKKYAVSVEYVEWPQKALKIESGDTVFDSEKLDRVLKYEYQESFEKWISSSVVNIANS